MTTREPDWDNHLRATFAAAPAPATPPGLSFRVQRQLHRRKLLLRGGASAAVAAVLALCILAWQSWPERPTRPEFAGARNAQPVPVEAELPEAAYLRSAPPVDTLDLLARQQAAYRTLLDDMEKEF